MTNSTPENLLVQTIHRIEGAYAPATLRAYKANFQAFIEFCDGKGFEACPASPESVAAYISRISETGLKASSIRIAVAAISGIHRFNRFPDPTKDPDVVIEVRRMHRRLGREAKQAYAINVQQLEQMVKSAEDSLRGLRDKAILLLAYDSLCRRSELVSLRLEDVYGLDGIEELRIRLRKSKTDQEALGRWLHMTERSRNAVRNWLEAAKISEGMLFRGVRPGNHLSEKLNTGAINKIYKRLAKRAALDAQIVEQISGHSLRVGAAQDLMSAGATMPVLMQRGRWTKPDTVMRYLENARELVCVRDKNNFA